MPPTRLSAPTAPRMSNLFAPGVTSARSPMLFAKEIFVVTKQLTVNLVISALSAAIRAILGSFSVQSWFICSITSPASLEPSPISTMSG